MRVLLAIAAFVMLCAIIWCFRTMKSGFTTLSADKERFRKKFQDEELRLSKEQRDISSAEQCNLLEAAVRDLLRLEERPEITVVRTDDVLEVTSPPKIWILSFHHRRENLKSTDKVLHGPGIWSLREGEERQEFPTIDQLMCAFQKSLRGQEESDKPDVLEENENIIALRRQHAAQRGRKYQ